MLGSSTSNEAGEHCRREAVRRPGRGEGRGRGEVDKSLRPAYDHAFDFVGEANRVGRVGDCPQAMIARQTTDQAELLGEHGTTGARRPQQDAAGADKPLVGRQHDVAARHQDVELGPVESPILDAQP